MQKRDKIMKKLLFSAMLLFSTNIFAIKTITVNFSDADIGMSIKDALGKNTQFTDVTTKKNMTGTPLQAAPYTSSYTLLDTAQTMKSCWEGVGGQVACASAPIIHNKTYDISKWDLYGVGPTVRII